MHTKTNPARVQGSTKQRKIGTLNPAGLVVVYILGSPTTAEGAEATGAKPAATDGTATLTGERSRTAAGGGTGGGFGTCTNS